MVVVDPRRTETARQFEHVAVRPDADAWLLLSMLHVIFDEGLADERVAAPSTPRARRRCARLARRAPAGGRPAARTGVAGRTRCARSRATSPRADGAAAYGRTGSCLGRFGTLVAFLIDALNAVTGNLDRPGGAVFGRPAIALDDVGERVGPRHLRQARARASATSRT